MGREGAGVPVAQTKDKRIAQVGIVVRDAVRAAREYTRIFGIGPWAFVDSVATEMIFHGKRLRQGESCVRLGLANLGELQIELLQPLYGPTTHMAFLQSHGEGIHHLSFSEIDDHDTFVSNLKDHGFDIEATGLAGGLIRYTYMATQDALGTIFEALRPVSPLRFGKT
jgi:hypothetical protein